MSSSSKIFLILILLATALLMLGCARNHPVEKPSTSGASGLAIKRQAKSGKLEVTDKGKPVQNLDVQKKAIPKIGFIQKYVSLNWIDNGKTRMKAKSREFKGDEITRQGVFQDFSAELYENGKLTATLKAPKALVDGDKRMVIASGGVKMKSMERETSMIAEKVTWYAKQKKIVGSGGVKVNSTTGQITAAEIETDTTLSKISVRGSK